MKVVLLLLLFVTTVFAQRGFTVYEHPNFRGLARILTLGSGCSNLPGDMNDKISSTNTAGHCVLLCEHAGCRGQCIRLAPGCGAERACCPNHKDLGADGCNFHDKASSYKPC